MTHSLESRAENSIFPVFNSLAAFFAGWFNPVVLVVIALMTAWCMYQFPFPAWYTLGAVVGALTLFLLARQLCRWLARQTSAYAYFKQNPDAEQKMLAKIETRSQPFYYEVKEFKKILRLPK